MSAWLLGAVVIDRSSEFTQTDTVAECVDLGAFYLLEYMHPVVLPAYMPSAMVGALLCLYNASDA